MNANANNFDPSGSGYYAHQSQGIPYYDDHQGDGEFYHPSGTNFNEYDDAAGYLDKPSYAMPLYQDPYGGWGVDGSVVTQDTESGYYYPTPPLTPTIYGAPVSAIAYDNRNAAIYVASHTQPFGERPRRASMLVTHSTLDGTLYSSCGGHPEAEMGILQSVYSLFFAGQGQASSKQRRLSHIPPHAYQPSYGATATIQQPQAPHMGITTLLSTTPGFVTSVSPAGVRVHTIGGLCVSDNDTSGMVCGTPHPESGFIHISVGGQNSQIHCMDTYQDLRTVSSHTFSGELGVMALESNPHKRVLIAGCSDGTLRLVDGRMRGAEVAKMKSHMGGVSAVATSHDGTLVATTGFAAKSGSSSSNLGPYAYPDPNLLIYDVRFLGRGGIVHTFSGVKSCPRFVSFLPDMNDKPNNRFLVASGQPNGGLQILTPFEDTDQNAANFIFPQLNHGESITCMTLSGDFVALGTSQSNILQYKLAGYRENRTKGAHNPESSAAFSSVSDVPSEKFSIDAPSELEQEEKSPLEMPNFVPEAPALTIDPSILKSPQQLGGMNKVLSSYIFCGNPTVSAVGSVEDSTFGPIARNPIIPSSKRTVAATILSAGSRSEGDKGIIVATTALDASLLPKMITPPRKGRKPRPLLANHNRFIFSEKLSSAFYVPDSRKKGKVGKVGTRNSSDSTHGAALVDNDGRFVVPDRYRLTLRPQNVATPHFEHDRHNDSGVWPGWDYPPSMPSSHVPSILVMLYFEPEVRAAMLERQFDKRLYSSKTVEQVPTLSTELGFLFHHMESISHNAMVYPGDRVTPHIDVFTPLNFLSAFAAMPEAVNLALLDDNPAVALKAQRPEAFYRFLLHHLDKEAGSKKNPKKPLDSIHGINFVSSNEFVSGSGKPTISTTRSLTLDLSYSHFINMKEKTRIRFGEVLRHSLCRETRLRAWNNTTQSYETVIQRKVATSLPGVLSISCACAGRRPEEGLCVWRTSFHDNTLWLPELIEIELEEDGNITLREQVDGGDNQKKWITFEGKSNLTQNALDLLPKDRELRKTKIRYRLESVLSFVRDDCHIDNDREGEAEGHHVLHVRVPPEYRKRALTKQREHAEQSLKLLQKAGSDGNYKLTLTSKVNPSVIKSRIESVKDCLKAKPNHSDWVLFNGYVVSSTSAEDARAFHVNFKEPCLLVYRAMGEVSRSTPKCVEPSNKEAVNAMHSKSISTGKPSKYDVKNINDLPGEGDIVALDAEFVSVQEEESVVGDSGNKIILRETRHALARVSVIDCRTRKIIIDDHVLPKEPVVDYLTRFSGILPGDLDPKTSPHHLVTARTAYLKLRFLMERGCIFLGHGLQTDFLTVNLYVPPCQIIDTVELYHKDRTRYISLRFLTNFVLKRDMQQDVHDSVEDAMAAYELYLRATELMSEGRFEQFLNELYEYGQRTDWRLGVDATP